MGKPFATELGSLGTTYDWALKTPIDCLIKAVDAIRGLPLLAAGSGGSFSAAHFAVELHQHFTGNPGQALTPLQLSHSPIFLKNHAVLLPTAGGKNPDVLGAFQHLVQMEPKRFFVWCGSVASRLATMSSKFEYVDFCEYALPMGKDGFLAVNSLLAFAVLLARAYIC